MYSEFDDAEAELFLDSSLPRKMGERSIERVLYRNTIAVDRAEYGGCCPTCGAHVSVPLPVAPLYSLAIAAEIVPCTPVQLRTYLQTHLRDAPKRFTQAIHQGSLHRMLTGIEIRNMRAHFVRFKDKDGKRREPDNTGA